MDRLETADILAVLKAAYPQFYNGLSPKEANKIVDLWAEMFKDEPVMVVAVAVKAMIASRTNTFPPNIGEVKEQITKMRMPKEKVWHRGKGIRFCRLCRLRRDALHRRRGREIRRAVPAGNEGIPLCLL